MIDQKASSGYTTVYTTRCCPTVVIRKQPKFVVVHPAPVQVVTAPVQVISAQPSTVVIVKKPRSLLDRILHP